MWDDFFDGAFDLFSSSSRRNRDRGFGTVGVLIGILVAILVVGLVISYNTTKEYANCTVVSKDRSTDRDNKSIMRVYTENCGTLQVSDSLLKGVFNSADLFGQLQEGKSYDFKAVGWRIPFFSSFPEVYEVTPN